MSYKNYVICVLLFMGLFLASCGPSPEQIATMTAAAWTPTPLPTATATPVPFDLTVLVTDPSGNPIIGANVIFPESGDDAPVQTNDSGQADWTNLSNENVSLSVSAQGYLPKDTSASLQRGPNEIAITMEADPVGLLPSAACAPGENPLYIEDFQDNQAQGWQEIDFHASGWNVSPDTETPGNIVASATFVEGAEGAYSNLQTNQTIDNAVWRMRFRYEGLPLLSLSWRANMQPIQVNGTQIDDSRYQIVLMGPVNPAELRRLQNPVMNIPVAGIKNIPLAENWATIEISTFEGETQVWINGMASARYVDPQPFPPGTIGIGVRMQSDKESVSFDNISVCELTAPFGSLAAPAP